MKVIICGSAPRQRPEPRPGWTDVDLLYRELNALDAERGPLTIVEGGAQGADRIARQWAQDFGREYVTHEANWGHGRAAGPIRNRAMLATGPDRVIAFSLAWPLSGGTLDMCIAASEALLPVLVVTPDGERRGYVAPGRASRAKDDTMQLVARGRDA